MKGRLRTFGELPAEMTVPNCEQVAVVQKVRNLDTRSEFFLGNEFPFQIHLIFQDIVIELGGIGLR